jgi:hypothetical protein
VDSGWGVVSSTGYTEDIRVLSTQAGISWKSMVHVDTREATRYLWWPLATGL